MPQCRKKNHVLPENSVSRAAVLQWNAVAHLMANIDIHLISNMKGQIDSLLSLDLTTHHNTMLVLC